MGNHSQIKHTPSFHTIACIGGGSGGHILPIVILHEHLKSIPDTKCVWI